MGNLDDFQRGLDRFSKEVQGIADRAAALQGEHQVGTSELFPPDFMQKHTRFSTFEEMCAAVGVATPEQFKAFPDSEWDAHVRAQTDFTSWAEMKSAGAKAWAIRKIRPT